VSKADLAACLVVDGERVAVFVFVVSNIGRTFTDPNARVLTAQVTEDTVLPFSCFHCFFMFVQSIDNHVVHQ
jgi:hypothetical protein